MKVHWNIYVLLINSPAQARGVVQFDRKIMLGLYSCPYSPDCFYFGWIYPAGIAVSFRHGFWFLFNLQVVINYIQWVLRTNYYFQFLSCN